jgi:hypothetical protein
LFDDRPLAGDAANFQPIFNDKNHPSRGRSGQPVSFTAGGRS